ncbi:MAG: glutathione S-transferase N-terminal domain-containing protein [Proteobacteria bacterium]|nr:glutathione S-transferase N-terminal domain-containing protein [Pseudomonadota bacterium]
MKIELYYAPIACSLVPYVTLSEAGADFDVRVVNFMKREHIGPEYLKLNPKHKVPVLVVDGEVLTENVAIVQWIARAFPRVSQRDRVARLLAFEKQTLAQWSA